MEMRMKWTMLEKMYGNLVVSAFIGNEEGRDQLVCVYDKLLQKAFVPAQRELEMLRTICKSDADWAAYYYFSGLNFEFAANMISENCEEYSQKALEEYRKSCALGCRLYLPHQQIAQAEYNAGKIEAAEREYAQAICCFEESGKAGVPYDHTLAALYESHAVCLTYLQAFERAEQDLRKSEELQKKKSGRSASWALLYGMQENWKEAEKYVKRAERESVALGKRVREALDAMRSE